MASERQIKGRIKASRNISQITQAMQMVAASKMRRAQIAAISGRPYAQKIAEMVSLLVSRIDPSKHPLLRQSVTGKTLIVLISTNKGLLGGLNANLFKSLSKWFSDEMMSHSVFVTLGKKGEQLLLRTNRTLAADFSDATPFTQSIPALTTFITEGFLKGDFKEVYVVFSNFLTALSQEPTKRKILPISEFTNELQQAKEANQPEKKPLEFVIEPSIDMILDSLLFHYLENQIRDALYEAEASEHSARMIAMKNATDNAKELIDILTLEYNKARQAKITSEIADIVTARMAVK